MHRFRNPGDAELSLLAQGWGLIGGGVELECFGDDRRSFTLNGDPFLKPSKSPEGQYAKPYRKCQLALPKTYVTRRGQMVLFTSPEDMILGQPVVLQHRKEVTSTAAANKLKTINRLVSSSLGYQPDKVQSSEVGEFTPVYLQRLREAAERARETENYQAQSMEKGEENMEEDDLEAADSGMGASLRPSSSGRLSSLSHYSDGTIIQIPSERLTEEREEDLMSPVDPLKQLAGELPGYTPSGQKSKTKSTTGKNTKKKKTEQSGVMKQKSSKTKGKKRKRSKKPKDDVDGGISSLGSSKVNYNDRTGEIERMKREKVELERQREREARERDRLEAELKRLRENRTKIDSNDQSDLSSNLEDRERREVGDQCHRLETRGDKSVTMVKGDSSGHHKTEDMTHRTKEGRRQSETETNAERIRQAHAKGNKIREKSNYNNHLELNTLRHSQAITPAYTFSYFQYVPPRTTGGSGGSKGGGGTGGKGVRGRQKTKRKKPPEK